MPSITKQPAKRLFLGAGAKRVSEKAADELIMLMEERAKLIATEAKLLSEHARRRTVMRQDIKAAKRQL